jgi:hypothetical protein
VALMRAFLRTRLGREIAFALVLKFIALYALWAVFFSHPSQPDAAAVAQAIAASPAASDLTRNRR